MKTKRIILLVATMLALGSINLQAQGLGGLLKKVKKGVEAVTGSNTSSSTATESTSSTTNSVDVPVEGGGTLHNPLSKTLDVQLVGAYGKSTSTNYGEVNLVFKVKMLANLTSVRFGVNSELPGLMIDQDGNTYKTRESAGWYSYDVTEGVYMKIPIKTETAFVDVKKTATTIQQLQIGISTSYENRGLIVLKNVPIKWDVEP